MHSIVSGLQKCWAMSIRTRNALFLRQLSMRYNLREFDPIRNWELTQKTCTQLKESFIKSENIKESLEYLDEISNEICLIGDLCNFLLHISNEEVYISAYVVYCKTCAFVEELNSDPHIHKKLQSFKSDHGFSSLDCELQHIIDKFLVDIQKSYINDGQDLSIKLALQAEINKAGQLFTKAAYLPVTVPLKNCPTPLFSLVNENKSKIKIYSYHLENRFDDVRECSWKSFHKFDEDKEEILVSLLNRRNQLARETGFGSFSSRELIGSLAGSPEKVLEFLNKLHTQLQPFVEHEMIYFNKIKRTKEPINIWDVDHYSAECQSKLFQHFPAFKANIPLSEVMTCIKKISQIVFQVSIVDDMTEVDKLWHKDVIKFRVYCNISGILLGLIYCDLYSRPEKSAQVSLYTLQCGTKKQIPVVALICNFADITIQYKDIELLFHEYGHAMHVILGRTHFQHASGSRCPTDFAEIPSTLLETLISKIHIFESLQFGKNASETKNAVGDISIFDCFSATATQVQIYFSILDQVFHDSCLKETQSISKTLQQEYLPHFDIPKNTAWHQRFTHLYQYGARYYSYLWARAIVNIIINQYELQSELRFVPEIRNLFEQGASKCYAQQIHEIVGGPIDTDEMVDSLIQPISSFQSKFLASKD